MTFRMMLTSAAAVLALGACANDKMADKPAPSSAASTTATGDSVNSTGYNAEQTVTTTGTSTGSAVGTTSASGDSVNSGGYNAGSEQPSVTVGGAAMLPNRTIVENASDANNLTTLVAAVKAADLVETLSGPGPFTVFAPVNSAFDNLPAGTVDTLLQPANKADLQGVLTYHVVSGTFDEGAIRAQKGDSLSTDLVSVQGGNVTISGGGESLYVIDSKGNAARIIQSDVYQSNGVVHVIDGVLLP